MRRVFAAAQTHWRDPLYRNGYLLMLNSLTGAAFGFAFWLAIARLFDDAAVGFGAAVVSGMTLVALLGKIGLDAVLVRYVPRASRRARARLVAQALVATGAATLALALLFLALVPRLVPELGALRGDALAGGVFAAGAVAIALGWVLDAYFVGERSAQWSLARNLVFNAVKLALPFLALFHASALGIPAAWAAGVAASLAAAAFVVPALLSRAPATGTDAPPSREVRRYSLLNYVQNVADFLPGLLLPLVVLHVAGSAANAYFYVAWTLAFIAFLASKSIAQSTFAELAHDARGVVPHLRKAALQNGVVLLPFLAFALLFGRPVLALYGDAYAENGALLLALLAVSAIPVAVNALYVTLLKARDANAELVALPLATLLVTFAIAYPLLVAHGLAGVGVGWLTANALVALWSGWRLATLSRRFEAPHDVPAPA